MTSLYNQQGNQRWQDPPRYLVSVVQGPKLADPSMWANMTDHWIQSDLDHMQIKIPMELPYGEAV